MNVDMLGLGETGDGGKAELQSGSVVIPHGVGLLDLLSVTIDLMISLNGM